MSLIEGERKREESSLSFKRAKLETEIDSWSAFAKALGVEDRELFKEMLRRRSDSFEMSEDATEALLISLLVSQQKEINLLTKRLAVLKSEARQS